MKKLLICLMALALMLPTALADTITVDGTVVSMETVPVLSTVDGTLSQVLLTEGDHVDAGQEAVVLYSVGVYANQSGTVRVMGAEGELVEALVERYGAVVYIEPDNDYTISASTRYAYDVEENKVIHPGETVYLRCATDGKHTGVGRVTAVSGTSFTVEVTSGEFESGENVYACRSTDYATNSRIGRGEAKHTSAVAYAGTGTGRVYGMAVQDGASVGIGDLLYTTVETSASYRIAADVAGTVAAVRVAAGDMIAQGSVIADIYPDEAVRVEIAVSENDLRDLHVGTGVTIEFKDGQTAEGVIDRISAVAQVNEDPEDDTVRFSAYIRFDDAVSVRYGMTAKVTTVEDAAE